MKLRTDLQTTGRIEAAKPKFNRYGSQLLSITNVAFLDADEKERFTFDVGERVTIRLHYKINDPSFAEKAIVHVSFLQDGVARTHRFTLDDELFDYNEADRGVLEITADPLLLGPGEYLVNVAAMREGGYARHAEMKFFTANENLLDHHSRAYRLVIRQTDNGLVNDVAFLHPVTWRRNGRVVFDGTYTLAPRGDGPSPSRSVSASVERLRGSILDLVRTVSTAGDGDPDLLPEDEPARDDQRRLSLDRVAAFEDLALLVDAAGTARVYGVAGVADDADTIARQNGFSVQSIDDAEDGRIGVAGVWDTLPRASDAGDRLERVVRRLAVDGLVVVVASSLEAPEFDGRSLNELLAAVGLIAIDTVGEGVIDYVELVESVQASSPAGSDLMAAIIRELAEPLQLVDRIAGFAPRARVIACRVGEASRFESAIARLRTRRAKDVFEATLSTGAEPDTEQVVVYLDPPSIAESERLFRARPIPIDAADIELSDEMMRRDGDRFEVRGVADTPHSYVMRTASRPFEAGDCVVAEGVLREGGLTIGLVRDERWSSQVNVTTSGGFRVAVQIPESGSFAVVLANCLPDGALGNDFDLHKFGIVHGRHSATAARG